MQEITIFDVIGNSIINLVQWDKDVKIFVREDEIDKAYNVHFFNQNHQDTAMVVESTYQDGVLSAVVPNDLLTEPHPIIGYIYVEKNNEHKSIYSFRIVVRKRPKPANYIYTDQKEYITFKKVLEEAKEYANNAKVSADNAKQSEDNAKTSEETAILKAEEAKTSANNALLSENNAKESEENSLENAENSEKYAAQAKSYAVGTDGTVRPNDNSDCAEYYYEQSKNNSEISKLYLIEVERKANEAIDNIKNALEMDSPNFQMDLSSGHLMYSGGRFTFLVNDTGYLEWGLVV